MVTKLSEKDKEYLLSLTPDDITFEKITELFSRRSKMVDGRMQIIEPKIKHYAEVDLKPNEYMNKTAVNTTAGLIVINKFLFEPHLKDITGYVNLTLDQGNMNKVNDKISKALLNDKIDFMIMADYLNRLQWLAMDCHTIFGGSFTMATLKPHPKVMAAKARLFKENAEALANGDAVKGAQIETELIEIAKKELAGDHGLDLYKSGARGSLGNNYKNMAIMRGPTIDPSTGKFDISQSNYMDGIRKDEIHIFGNSIVSGAYPKAIGTATSGYFSKQIMAAQQAVVLDAVGTDCKSKKVIFVQLTPENKKDYMYRFIIDKGKIVCLDDETIDKYMGQYVTMRSVMYCTSPEGKICYTCAGKLFFLLNIRNSGLTSSRVASTLLNLSMKKFHDPSIKLYKINLSTMMLSTKGTESIVKESSDLDALLQEIEEETLEEIVMETEIPARSVDGAFFHASSTQNLKTININPSESYPSIGNVVFASQSVPFATCFGGRWTEEQASIDIVHSRQDDEYTVRDVKQVIFTYDPNLLNLDDPCSLYQVSGRFNYLSYKGDLELISRNNVRVVRETQYSSWKEMMVENNVKIIEMKG